MIPKCCCCFDLRWGYYTYAVVIVGLRLSTFSVIYSWINYLCTNNPETCGPNILRFAFLMGWCFTYILYCFLAIAGIIKERSAMIYPCIVLLTAELVITTIFYLMIFVMFYISILSIFIEHVLVIMITSACIYGYDLCCLIALHKKLKKAESSVNIFSNCNRNI